MYFTKKNLKGSFGTRVFSGIGEYYPGPSPNPRSSPISHLVEEFRPHKSPLIPGHPDSDPFFAVD
jgi:hypothetical protein